MLSSGPKLNVKTVIALKPFNPGKPKFLGPFEDKYNVNEGETVFVTLKLEPGDPVPTSEQIEWIKNGAKDMSVFPR